MRLLWLEIVLWFLTGLGGKGLRRNKSAPCFSTVPWAGFVQGFLSSHYEMPECKFVVHAQASTIYLLHVARWGGEMGLAAHARRCCIWAACRWEAPPVGAPGGPEFMQALPCLPCQPRRQAYT